MRVLSTLGTNIDVNILNFKKVLDLVRLNQIDIVIVGPEEPLVKGIVDYLKKIKLKYLVLINMLQN